MFNHQHCFTQQSMVELHQQQPYFWTCFNQAWAIQMNGTLDGTVILVLPKSQKIRTRFILLLSLPIRTVKQVPVNTNRSSLIWNQKQSSKILILQLLMPWPCDFTQFYDNRRLWMIILSNFVQSCNFVLSLLQFLKFLRQHFGVFWPS